MDLSLFLAKVLGVYLIITSLFLLFRKDLVKLATTEMFNSSALMVFSGALNLILGLLIVFSHNIWEASYRVIITLFGWIGIVSGVIRLLVPEWSKRFVGRMGDMGIAITGLAFLLIGLYLTYVGIGFHF